MHHLESFNMKFSSTIRAALVSIAVLLAGPASAYYFKGDTTGSPTYDRSDAVFSELPMIGEDVAYDVFSFSVVADGVYTFGSRVSGYFQGAPSWDQYLFLYSDSFDPTAPLSNGVVGNDDYNNSIGRSGFEAALSAGTSYFLVTTGYAADDSGEYLNWIHGGTVVPGIPESGTYTLFALGLVGVMIGVRRRTDANLGG
jgi:hypothetical protein